MPKRPAAKPPPIRMVILLDGTWQTDKGDTPPTNVVRLRDLILPKEEDGKAPFIQHIYYDSGVGTGGPITRRSYDGATGNGLEDIVRGAYRALCHRYVEGMEIYVFGFSRGAFSARSLVGYINAAGLLKAEHCTTSQEKKAWEFYRKPRRYRIPGEKRELDKLCWPATPHIKCLGVFDTVGARGIPSSVLRRRNEERYGFHDTGLSSIVDYAFHALALDEKRRHYVATLWSYAFHHNNKGIEQVWFPGCHSDVGGGVEEKDVAQEGLSSLPLYWMIRRILDNKLGLQLDEDGVEKVRKKRDATAAILGGKGLMYRMLSLPPAHRSVSQTQPNESHELFLGLPRHLRPIREAVHWSVFARIGGLCGYRPKNVFHEDFWNSVFVDGTATDTDVVGMEEQFLEWWTYKKDYHAMLDILPKERHKQFEDNVAKYILALR